MAGDYQGSALPVRTATGKKLDINLVTLNGVTVSNLNPLPVSIESSPVLGIIDSHTALDVPASGGVITHTYTVSGSPFNLDKVTISSSGQMRGEIKVGPGGSEVSKHVMFTSKGNPTEKWDLPYPISVPVGQNVLVVKTNEDDDTMNLYSTIQGH